MNKTSCRHFGGIIFGECSGYGECLPLPTPFRDGELGYCKCIDGHGPADFLNSEGLDCLVNTTVLNAWWNILTVLYGIVTLYGVAKSLPVFAKVRTTNGLVNQHNPISRLISFAAGKVESVGHLQ